MITYHLSMISSNSFSVWQPAFSYHWVHGDKRPIFQLCRLTVGFSSPNGRSPWNWTLAQVQLQSVQCWPVSAQAPWVLSAYSRASPGICKSWPTDNLVKVQTFAWFSLVHRPYFPCELSPRAFSCAPPAGCIRMYNSDIWPYSGRFYQILPKRRQACDQ